MKNIDKRTLAKLQTSFCKRCNQELHRNRFALDKRGHLKGRICKECSLFRLNNGGHRLYRKYKSSTCSFCGFIGEPCQLDIDHIDNNHLNNKLENLQTLCANCHRLKSHKAKIKSI